MFSFSCMTVNKIIGEFKPFVRPTLFTFCCHFINKLINGLLIELIELELD